VTGHGSGSGVASAPATPSTPSTLFQPAPSMSPTLDEASVATSSSPAVLISADASSLIVLSQGRAFEVDVAKPPDTIASYVARPPSTVVTLTNGLVRAFSRDYPQGIDLGSARAVFPSADPRRVWLSSVVDGGAAVKEMRIDGRVLPQLATGFVRLPDGYDVVGVAGDQLVLSGADGLRTWDPSSRLLSFVSGHGTLLASSAESIVWTRPDCTSCGIFLLRGDRLSLITGVANVDPTVPGAFSPDGRFLAVAITGAWPGGGTGAVVHAVAVIDLDPTNDHGAFDVQTPDIRSTTPVGMTWSSGGALLVRDTSDRIVAYEPIAGGMANMFSFRPRDQRQPTTLTSIAPRIPHASPPTTYAPS